MSGPFFAQRSSKFELATTPAVSGKHHPSLICFSPSSTAMPLTLPFSWLFANASTMSPSSPTTKAAVATDDCSCEDKWDHYHEHLQPRLEYTAGNPEERVPLEFAEVQLYALKCGLDILRASRQLTLETLTIARLLVRSSIGASYYICRLDLSIILRLIGIWTRFGIFCVSQLFSLNVVIGYCLVGQFLILAWRCFRYMISLPETERQPASPDRSSYRPLFPLQIPDNTQKPYSTSALSPQNPMPRPAMLRQTRSTPGHVANGMADVFRRRKPLAMREMLNAPIADYPTSNPPAMQEPSRSPATIRKPLEQTSLNIMRGDRAPSPAREAPFHSPPTATASTRSGTTSAGPSTTTDATTLSNMSLGENMQRPKSAANENMQTHMAYMTNGQVPIMRPVPPRMRTKSKACIIDEVVREAWDPTNLKFPPSPRDSAKDFGPGQNSPPASPINDQTPNPTRQESPAKSQEHSRTPDHSMDTMSPRERVLAPEKPRSSRVYLEDPACGQQ